MINLCHILKKAQRKDRIQSIAAAAAAKSLQSCPTLCDPMACSLLGSSVHGIFQAIVLEWIVISFSRGSSQPRDQTQVSRIVDQTLHRLSHQGSQKSGQLPTNSYFLIIEKILISHQTSLYFSAFLRIIFHFKCQNLNDS